MPQIRIYEGQLNTRGQLATPSQSHVSQAGSGFANIGQALARVSEIKTHLERYERQSKLNTAKAEGVTALDNLKFELENDDDFSSQPARYDSSIEKIKSDFEKKYGDDPAVFKAWDQDFNLYAQKGSFEIRRRAIKGQIGQQITQLDSNLDTWIQQAAKASDDLEVQAAIDEGRGAIMSALQAGALSEVDAKRKGNTFLKNLTESRMRELILSDPFTALEELGSEKVGRILDPELRRTLQNIAESEADKAIDESLLDSFDTARLAGKGPEFLRSFIDSPPDDIEQIDVHRLAGIMEKSLNRDERLQKEALAKAEKQMAFERSRQASDLELGVKRGDLGEDDIEQAFNDKVITGAKRTELITFLDKKAEHEQKIADEQFRITTAISNGIPLDAKNTDDVKAIDNLYANLINENELHPLSPEGMTLGVQITQATTILPTHVRSMIRTFARSGDVNQAAAAAEYISRLNESVPQVLDTMPDDEKAFSMIVSSAVSAGMESDLAVELARNRIYETSKAERDALKANLSDPEIKKQNLNTLNKLIDDHFDPIFRAQPSTTAALTGEYNNLVDLYFTKTQDLELARNLAWGDLTRVWGTTDINGDGLMLMKYPPEKLYGNGRSAKWMQQQFKADMAVFGLAEDTEVMILSDDLTARSRNPSYALMQRNEDGMIVPLLDDQNRPARWRPDYSQTEEAKDLKRQQKENIENAKKKRAEHFAMREKTIKKMKDGTLFPNLNAL